MRRLLLPALGLLAALAAAAPAAADRALLVAIDDYAEPGFGLGPAPAVGNLETMTALLTGPALRYRPADIRTLRNDAATGAAILDAIRDWLGGAAPGERLFLYFSGRSHGALLPVDARLTADGSVAGGLDPDSLAAALKGLAGHRVTVFVEAPQVVATRAIRVEAAGTMPPAPVPTAGLGPDIAVLTGGNGATADFVAAVTAGDPNGNGVLSHAELFASLSGAAAEACALDAMACPTFGPPEAAGASPTTAAPPADAGRLTPGQVLDYLAKGNTGAVTLEQLPPSPVRVGTRDIRFRVTSPTAGTLVLLDLGDDGTLTQLFPNAYVRDAARAGVILADSPIVVPDDYYGLRFNATSPTKGTLIALVTTTPVTLPPAVATRSIEVIPRAEATTAYLPAIVGTLVAPPPPDTPPTGWSVATLPYEIVP